MTLDKYWHMHAFGDVTGAADVAPWADDQVERWLRWQKGHMDTLNSGRFSTRGGILQAMALAAAGMAVANSASAGDQRPPGPSDDGATDGMNLTVTLERHGQVLLIGINRPAMQNRLDPVTYQLLGQAYFLYEHDHDLRAAVLFGHGDHFCKGIDVTAFETRIAGPSAPTSQPDTIDPFGKTLPRLSKPIVAVAHGDTWNIGHELCLAADIRVASVDTQFAQMECTQARMPGSGATVRFVRDAGWGHAMQHILTGDSWGAEEAKRMGVIQEVAPDQASALELGIDIATKIAACAPLSIKTTLASAHFAIDKGEDNALLALNAQRSSLYRTQDFQEGMRSHAEGRTPIYEGR